jgi:hypothetical protein
MIDLVVELEPTHDCIVAKTGDLCQ